MDANKQYLLNRINPLLEPLITDILASKPDDPIPFLIDWLHKRSNKNKQNLEEEKVVKKSKKAKETPPSSDVIFLIMIGIGRG